MDISIVVPLFNEEESLPELCTWIDKTHFIQILVSVLFINSIYCAILALFIRKKEQFIKTN